MIIPVNLKTEKYDIVLERGALKKAGELVNLDRRVFIVTDSGVPGEYARIISEQCRQAHIESIPQGEESKSMKTLERLLQSMLEFGMDKGDLVVSAGGGVAGDIGGFAASCYMRGIDFCNIPTTLLAQVDAAAGGKTAVNFGGIKNLVGAFYQPVKVIIDTDVLKTLPPRLINEGMAESIKMSLTCDGELFEIIEKSSLPLDSDTLETIIERSLRIKACIVEKDERDKGLRQILNFGHTIGHAIESANGGVLLHGECVALGMAAMCSDKLRPRLINILKKYSLPYEIKEDIDTLMPLITHDKKKQGDGINCVLVHDIGEFEIKKLTEKEITELIENYKRFL